MFTYSLDAIENYQDWLKTSQAQDSRLRSQSYEVFFKFKNDRVNATIENENRLMSIASNKTYYIPRRDRDLAIANNKEKSCDICFLYNPSTRDIDIEISGINDLLGNKYDSKAIRLFKLANIGLKKNKPLIRYYEPNVNTLYEKHHVDRIKDIHERLLLFINDIESILTIKAFMTTRELKRQAHARSRSDKRSRRYKRLTGK